MRISVQARQPQSGDRWQRSIYLDSESRDIIIAFDEMTAVGSGPPFNPALADTLLFVVEDNSARERLVREGRRAGDGCV
jgi:hypothetical protein